MQSLLEHACHYTPPATLADQRHDYIRVHIFGTGDITQLPSAAACIDAHCTSHAYHIYMHMHMCCVAATRAQHAYDQLGRTNANTYHETVTFARYICCCYCCQGLPQSGDITKGISIGNAHMHPLSFQISQLRCFSRESFQGAPAESMQHKSPL